MVYLAATQDALVRPRSYRLIQRYAPELRLVALHAPHLLLQVAPVEAGRAISEFAAHAAGS
jgi:pimeloyl-[acyl-carrier protein] methyl ester esterase